MDLDEKKIIAILPLNQELKDKLLAEYDGLDEETKVNISQIVWDAYDTMYDMALQQNLQLAFLRVEKGEEKMDQDFYLRVRKQTEQELSEQTTNVVEKVELDSVRQQLQNIISK